MNLRERLVRATDAKSGIGRAAQKISNVAGGKGITDYFGGRGSKSGAIKSAARVAGTIGTLAAGGALGAVAKAGKGMKAAKVARGVKVKGFAGRHTPSTARGLRSSSHAKRLRRGGFDK